MTDCFRVVVGHEPRFYREALAEALRCLCPDLEIVLTDPATLDQDVDYDCAQVVICSRVSAAIEQQALAWVLLYPNGANRAVISIAGRQRETDGFEIADLLAVIEEAWTLANPEDEGTIGRACEG
jgi:hypothetical protein